MKKNLLLLLLVHSYVFVFSTPDTWLQKASLPAQPRVAAVAFAINGFGYIGTGLDSVGNLLNDFWKYDPANDSWTQAATFIGSARKNAVAFVTDTFAYVGTGYDSAGLTKDFYKYDSQNNSWQRIEDLDSAGAVYPRRDAAAFSLGNKGYVVGGYDGSAMYSKDTWQYDPTLDTVWNEKTLFPLAGRRWATAFSINGFGFVGMGYNYSQEYFHDLWKYDSTSDTWTQMADYIGNKRGYAASFVLYYYAFVGTGFDGALKNDFYKYSYGDNAWTLIANFGGTPTSGAASFAVNGKGYVFGGGDTLGYKNELWEYDPENIVGIENGKWETGNGIQLYPNPSHDQFTVYPPKDGFAWANGLRSAVGEIQELKLFSASGKLILTQNISSSISVNVNDLPRGMYYYSVTLLSEKKQIATGKIILQ